MSTPSARIWAALRNEDSADRLREHLPARAARPETLAAAADRIASSVPLRDAVADFLDDLRWARDSADLRARIADEPRRLDAHADAYLAAVAEHVAAVNGLPVPGWTRGKERFLDHFWWPSRTKALRARAVVESPGLPPPRDLHRRNHPPPGLTR